MNKTILILVLLFVSLGAGCASIETVESTNIKPADIYQDYNITANRFETKTYAVFRVGGSTGKTVDLDAPSKIEVDGEPLPEIAPSGIKGTDYQLNEKVAYKAAREFVFTNADGKVYRNTIGLAPIEFTAKEGFMVSASKRNFLPLSRISLDEKEQFEIYMTNERFVKTNATPSNINIEAKFDREKNALIVEPEILKNIPAGNATVFLNVSKTSQLQNAAGVGGRSTIKYYAKPIQIKIVK